MTFRSDQKKRCYWCRHWFDCQERHQYRERRYQADDCATYEREPGADDDKDST